MRINRNEAISMFGNHTVETLETRMDAAVATENLTSGDSLGICLGGLNMMWDSGRKYFTV